MTFLAFCQWIEKSALGSGVRDSVWVFPVTESIHILGIVLLVFTASQVDLRVLGTGFLRRRPLAEVAAQLLPWMWRAVVLVILTGIALFASEAASKCYESKAFYVKMALIVIAVLNAAFSGATIRRYGNGRDGSIPARARVMAMVSLITWAGTVFAGRAIAYF
jgi:Family of unknown function (DUF6644)